MNQKDWIDVCTNKVCPESFQPCTRKNRDIYWRRYKIEETLCIGKWCLSPLQSRHLGTSYSSLSISSTVENTLQTPLLELPSATLSCFPQSHQQFEISSLSKVILVLGKARSLRAPNLGCRGLSHLGDFMFHQKLCPRRDAWVSMLSWWSCQSPVAHSCRLLSHLNTFKLNAKFDAVSLLYLCSHLECNSHTIHGYSTTSTAPTD